MKAYGKVALAVDGGGQLHHTPDTSFRGKESLVPI
jgi:hypothetical protein